MAILGIDEVGRGPLAGPLVVGAVVLPENAEEFAWYKELRDSKKIGPTKRRRLAAEIQEAAAVGLGWISNAEIDEIGMPAALRRAAREAVKKVQARHVPFSQVIIDGNENFLEGTALEKYTTTLVKGDNLVKEISAASIVAKVARDDFMIEMAEEYPDYGFERNMGYGTEEHREAIFDFGVCPLHRKSFEPIRSMVGFRKPKKKASGSVVKNTTKVGQKGEEAVAKYLEERGHRIIVRNHKTKRYEIDIVSIFQDKIYFTEVKTRGTEAFGGGLAAVGTKKLEQMRFAAKCFMSFFEEFDDLNPQLAVAAVDGNYKVLEFVEILE